MSVTVNARLADPAHKLPMPGQPGSFFPAAGRAVDLSDPFWHALVADGSLVIVEDPLPPDEGADAFGH